LGRKDALGRGALQNAYGLFSEKHTIFVDVPQKLWSKTSYHATAPKGVSDRCLQFILRGTSMHKLMTASVLVVTQLVFTAIRGLGHEADKDELPLIEKAVVPESIKGLSWGATIDLGSLDSGKKYRIRLDVTNPSGSVMSFSKLTKNSSSFDAEVSGLVLKPGQALSIELTATVPTKLGRSDSNWYFMLEPTPGSTSGGIYVRLNYAIAGVMEFLQRRVVYELLAKDGKEHFLIPMLITPPIDPKHLYFTFPNDWSALKGDTVTKDGKHFLQITVDPASLKSRYLAGEIGCLDTLTGREDVVYCVLKKSNDTSVHPEILRVVVPDETVDYSYVTALIRVTSDTTDDKKYSESELESKRPVVIDALLGDDLLPLSVNRLSASTFRVKISLSEALVKAIKNAPSPQIRWVIKTHDLSYEVISRLSIP
jgi:hypothetical protein